MATGCDIFCTPAEGVRKTSLQSQWKLLFLVIGLFSPFLTCCSKNLIFVIARYVTALVHPPLVVRMCFLSSA